VQAIKACDGVKVYFHTFLTLALDEGKRSTSCLTCFLLRKTPIPTEKEVGWDPDPFWTFAKQKNLLLLLVFRPQIFQPVA
jgi:hypothetical protein